jgi:hypothetical protein
VKLLLIILFIVSFVLLRSNLAGQDSRDLKVFTGEVSDNQCAVNGSHEPMRDKVHARNAKECAQECVRAGARYVLFEQRTKAIYQLDDQIKSDLLAGQAVAVTGTYDEKSKTIHVMNIAPTKFAK